MLRELPCGGVPLELPCGSALLELPRTPEERWLPDGGRATRGIIDAFDPDASIRPTDARIAWGPFEGSPAALR